MYRHTDKKFFYTMKKIDYKDLPDLNYASKGGRIFVEISKELSQELKRLNVLSKLGATRHLELALKLYGVIVEANLLLAEEANELPQPLPDVLREIKASHERAEGNGRDPEPDSSPEGALDGELPVQPDP